MICLMEKVYFIILMGTFMMVGGKMIKNTVMEHTHIKMEIYTRVNGKIIYKMEQVRKHGWMDQNS